jgi:hypothetical protein
MERQLLLGSTLCFLVALAHTLATLREGVFHPRRFNFFAIALGFALQSAFLYVRGHALGRCPITNLFEVFIFLAWSVALIYLAIGLAHRLSLAGASPRRWSLAHRPRASRADRCPASGPTGREPWPEPRLDVDDRMERSRSRGVAGVMYPCRNGN